MKNQTPLFIVVILFLRILSCSFALSSTFSKSSYPSINYSSYTDEDITDAAPSSETEVGDNLIQYNYDENENLEREEKSSSSIQFMITHRMRRFLEVELGYLPEEIDVMEPQIAAVVIDRELARPTGGMPSSWRIPQLNEIQKGKNNNRLKLITSLKNSSNNIKDRIQQSFVKALPLLIPVAVSLCGLTLFKVALENGGLSAIKYIGNKVSTVFQRNSPKPSMKNKKAMRKNLIDLSSLQKIQDENMLGKLKINLDVLRNKYI